MLKKMQKKKKDNIKRHKQVWETTKPKKKAQEEMSSYQP